jgi:hypothetical protein
MTMEPLLVTAELANGFCASDPWSPSLEGVLAYWVLRERLGEEAFALGASGATPPVVLGPGDLPVEAELWDDLFWWRCSSPLSDAATVHRRFVHRRFDHFMAERFADTGRSGRVLVTGGPFKNYRFGEDVRVCREVRWHVVGDAAEVRRLLRRCGTIGRGGGRGLGQVRAWRVEAGGDARLARFHRPLPVGFAAEHGIHGVLMDWGIRPPGRLRAHRVLCVMPPPG